MNYKLLATAFVAATILFAAPAGAQSTDPTLPSATAAPDPYVTMPPALPPLVKYAHYVSGGYFAPAIVCNEFTFSGPCLNGDRYKSFFARGAFEFPIVTNKITGMIGVDYRRYGYTHPAGAIPLLPAGSGFGFLPNAQLREDDLDFRAGVRALEPRLYLAASYLTRTGTTGYPRLRGWGIGLEKIADTDQTFSLYGSAYYYPELRGSFTAGLNTFDLAYHVVRYDVGLTLKNSNPSPIFLSAGYMGDQSRNAENSPLFTLFRRGPYVGLGLAF